MKKYRKCRPSRPKPTPIPFVISFELAFISEDLERDQYAEEVRRVVREKLPEVDYINPQGGMWEEFDEFVSEVIAEELQKN